MGGGGGGGSDPPMLLHAGGLGVLNIPYAVAQAGSRLLYTVVANMEGCAMEGFRGEYLLLWHGGVGCPKYILL
jgi:hypothetical protein